MRTLITLSLRLLCSFAITLAISGYGFGQKLLTVDEPIPDKYIVALDIDVNDINADINSIAQDLVSTHGGTVGHVYSVLPGFSLEADEKAATDISDDPRVKYVTQDSTVQLTDTQTNAPWNLDRIDQRDLPLSTTYTYFSLGYGSWIYVIDSGISASHPEFTAWPGSGGRVYPGPNFAGGSNADCIGHGTHVAGIAAGDTYGVAKRAFLVPVRVFNCDQNSPVSTIIQGVDWVRNNHVAMHSVVNLSFSGGPNQAIDDAVRNLIASGVMCVIAAGNDGVDANNISPARVREALTVGNVNNSDARDSLSNFGTAIDVFAPGENIVSAGLNNTLSTRSGTSMSAPHVTGVIALTIGGWPSQTSPSQIQNSITAYASLNKISNVAGSPNQLLYSNVSIIGSANLPFYRHRNASTNSNLYVLGWDELGGGNFGYVLQEVEGWVATNTDNYTNGPLYRYFNASTNDYLYTMNWSELGNGANGYVFQKVEGYPRWGPQSGSTVALHRYWNPTIQKHYYTSDFSELGNGANGYVYEGITGYLWIN